MRRGHQDRSLETGTNRLLWFDFDVRHEVFEVIHDDCGLNAIANVQFCKLGVRLDWVLHSHRSHPIADLAGADGRVFGNGIENLNFALHLVVFGFLLGATGCEAYRQCG